MYVTATNNVLTDYAMSRYLYLPLFDAERSWAYAMELKSESNTEPRKKFHMMNKLKKAVEHASDLQMIVSNEHLPCDALTKLEANVSELL